MPGTRSTWFDEPLHLERAPLSGGATADVCVVGAGMAGICCAYQLARHGFRVIVLEQRCIGAGESGRTTAHLANAVDDRYSRIEDARVCAESHTAAIAAIERMVEEEAIDCGFERLDGWLFLPPGESEEVLVEELDAARRAGVAGVELHRDGPPPASGPCLRFPQQGQFHPMRFLSALARAAERLGARIHTGTRMIALDREGAGLCVRTQSGPVVSAAAVVVATNSPANDRFAIHTKQNAYRTYALAARIPRGAVERALYWDTSQQAGDLSAPYHYVRLAASSRGAAAGGEELLIVGGEDHRTGADDADDVAPGPWERLEQWARAWCPVMSTVVHRWSGQVQEPHDGIAFIGANPGGPKGVFVVTGDSGMGMTHATIAALMMPDLIRGTPHPWSATYDPSRKPLRALREFATENLRTAAQYADWLGPGAEESEIAPGTGRVVRHGLKLLAVHRDELGVLHVRSAVCPHLGCVVRWNSAEGSWDCPCHGSRFDACGAVLNAPASRDLTQAADENVVAPAARGPADRQEPASR